MGGTAGLFLGASLLTLVELVYYACRTPSYKLLKEQEAQAQQAKSSAAAAGPAGMWNRFKERGSPAVRRVQPALPAPVSGKPPVAPPIAARLPIAADPFDLYM